MQCVLKGSEFLQILWEKSRTPWTWLNLVVLLLAMKMMSFYPHPLLFYKEPEQSLTLTLAKRNNKCWLLKFPVFMVLGSLMAIRPLPHTCKCCEVFTFIHHFKTVIILESVNKSQKKPRSRTLLVIHWWFIVSHLFPISHQRNLTPTSYHVIVSTWTSSHNIFCCRLWLLNASF